MKKKDDRNNQIELFRLFKWVKGDQLYSYARENLDQERYGIIQYTARRKWNTHFSFAIPSFDILEEISLYTPIIEIGAGTGYWAYLLKKYFQVDIICYDKMPFFNYTRKKWFKVMKGTPKVLREYSNRTLFLCFPSRKTSMANDSLKYWKGKYLIFIGEYRSGLNANDVFFNRLDSHFTLKTTKDLFNWEGMYNKLKIYQRKNRLTNQVKHTMPLIENYKVFETYL